MILEVVNILFGLALSALFTVLIGRDWRRNRKGNK